VTPCRGNESIPSQVFRGWPFFIVNTCFKLDQSTLIPHEDKMSSPFPLSSFLGLVLMIVGLASWFLRINDGPVTHPFRLPKGTFLSPRRITTELLGFHFVPSPCRRTNPSVRVFGIPMYPLIPPFIFLFLRMKSFLARFNACVFFLPWGDPGPFLPVELYVRSSSRMRRITRSPCLRPA